MVRGEQISKYFREKVISNHQHNQKLYDTVV